jgi:hypothetical protein
LSNTTLPKQFFGPKKMAGSAASIQWVEIREGVPMHGGTPIAGWFMRENPNLKWMVYEGKWLQK